MFDRPLAHLFRLLQVTDAFGNTKSVDDHYNADVHDLPRAVFDGCEGSKIRDEEDASADIPLLLNGAEPLAVSIEYRESMDAKDPVLFKVPGMKSGRNSVPVGKPGVYTVKLVEDKYCAREAQSTCVVSKTIAPSVSITSSPIDQFCVGTIGMLGMRNGGFNVIVDVSFTGEPPFWLEYEQTRGDNSEIFRVSGIKTTHHALELKPENDGTYIYSFLSIGDVNYKDGIELVDQDSITHIIHPQSTAAFRDKRGENIVKCLGDTVTLPVVLSGSKPWKLSVCWGWLICSMKLCLRMQSKGLRSRVMRMRWRSRRLCSPREEIMWSS